VLKVNVLIFWLPGSDFKKTISNAAVACKMFPYSNRIDTENRYQKHGCLERFVREINDLTWSDPSHPPSDSFIYRA